MVGSTSVIAAFFFSYPPKGDRRTLRGTADLVLLLQSDNSNYGGLADYMPTGGVSHHLPIGVVAKRCAESHHCAGHEVGHNLGAHHDDANASGAPGVGKGTLMTSQKRTIMA